MTNDASPLPTAHCPLPDLSDLSDLSSYDYHLPEDRIAKYPAEQRDQARLLVLDRATQTLRHRCISDLPELLQLGDCLVLNDTKVLPARLLGTRATTGGKWEGLFLESTDDGQWQLIGQTRGHLKVGEELRIDSIHHPDLPPLRLRLEARLEDGIWSARLSSPESAAEPAEVVLQRYGTLPLPPYMQRKIADSSDWGRYQTTYADRAGSVAAPTAGLHFTPELLDRCRQRGIDTARVTLHVGIGTFKPIAVTQLADHKMHSEWCEISSATVEQLRATRQRGGRVIVVGTTSVRTLESASQSGELAAWSGHTRLFIRPPYEFRSVDGLLTNFHLPKSTLLVLVSALAGADFVRHAYQTAIDEGYRFYSYGDAMLVL